MTTFINDYLTIEFFNNFRTISYTRISLILVITKFKCNDNKEALYTKYPVVLKLHMHRGREQEDDNNKMHKFAFKKSISRPFNPF